MRSSADEVQIVTIDLVYQQPIRFDVAVAVVLPVAPERVIPAALRQGTSLDQQQNHLAKLRHILTAFLCKLHIAP